MTSYALSGDDVKALEAGCDAYVTKPFSPRALLAKIREYPCREDAAARILVADDNAMNVDILRTRLAAHGYEIADCGGWRGGAGPRAPGSGRT